jgi:hypothetical protein
MTSKRITDTLRSLLGPVQSVPTVVDLTIRFARPDEAEALAALARLDSSHAPQGTVLVADVRGELWAAVSVDDGHAVANPFRPSGELTFRLAEHARELHRASGDGLPPRRRPNPKRRPALAGLLPLALSAPRTPLRRS